METITKSTRKSLLAAAVVALMALVAVAGVVTYDADNADAADSGYTYLNGDVVINSDLASSNIFIATEGAAKDSSITVPAGVTYNGTIACGYHKVVDNVTYDVIFNEVSFENGITDATVTCSNANISITTNGSTAADVTIVSGGVMFYNFTGTATVADQTVAMKDASGVGVILYNGTAALVGIITSGTVTVNGTFDIIHLEIGNAEFNVPEGSTATAAALPFTTYAFNIAYKTASSTALTATDVSVYMYGNGTAITSGYTLDPSTAGILKFSGMTAGTYTVAVAVPGTGAVSTLVYDVVLFDGQAYIIPTFSVVLDQNTATYVAADGSAAAHYEVTFRLGCQCIVTPDQAAAQKVTVKVYSALGTTTELTGASFSIKNGIATVSLPVDTAQSVKTAVYYVTFADMSSTGFSAVSTYVAKLTLTQTVSGTAAPYTYDDGTAAVAFTDSITTGTDTAKATVTSTYNENSGATIIIGSIRDAQNDLISAPKAAVNIAGTVDLGATAYKDAAGATKYTYSDVVITAGTMTVTGKVVFQMDLWADSPLAQYDTLSALFAGKLTINAVSYAAAVADDTDPTTLHTIICTNFADALDGAKALTDNALVSVMGTVTVTEDVTIPTATAGETGKNTLEIDIGVKAPTAYGTLVIGTADKAAVVTVPKDASGNVTSLYVKNGLINVLNGALKIEGLSEDAAAYEYKNGVSDNTGDFTAKKVGVKAAVFITDDTYGIYTDLTTALAAATAGDTVDLRGNAIILEDTALIAEVTLNLNGYDILVGHVSKDGQIDAQAVFTVDGTIANGLAAGPTLGVIYVVAGSSVNVNVSDLTDDQYAYQLGISAADAAVLEDLTITVPSTNLMGFIDGGALTVGKDATVATVRIYAMGGTLTVDGTLTAPPQLNSYTDGQNGYSAAATDKGYALTMDVIVNGKMTLEAGDYGFIVASDCTLNLEVAGTLTMVGTDETPKSGIGDPIISSFFVNLGTMKVTVAAEGTIVSEGYAIMINTGLMDITVAGQITRSETETGRLILISGITPSTTIGAVSADEKFTMNVTGSVDLYYTIIYSTDDTVTVSGTGVLSIAYGAIRNLTVTDTAKFTSEYFQIYNLTVKGSATVIETETEDTAGAIGLSKNPTGIIVMTAVIGEPTAKLSSSVNSATVEVTLAVSSSTEESTIVYGTADNVKISAPTSSNNIPKSNSGADIGYVPSTYTLVQTAMWLVGEDNCLYATQYSVSVEGVSGTSLTAAQSFPAVELEGYVLDGWFEARAGGTTADQTAKVGDYSDIYARFTAKAYTLTLGYVPGAVYLVNNNQMPSGQSVIHYGDVLVISVIAADGYSADSATLGDGQASVTINVTGDVTVTAAGLNTVGGDSNGIGLTDILLIILVLTTGVVMIVILIRTLRS